LVFVDKKETNESSVVEVFRMNRVSAAMSNAISISCCSPKWLKLLLSVLAACSGGVG